DCKRFDIVGMQAVVYTYYDRVFFFFFQAEDGIRDLIVTGVQTCALPSSGRSRTHPTRPKPTPRPCRVARSPCPRLDPTRRWKSRSGERRVGKGGKSRGGGRRLRKKGME